MGKCRPVEIVFRDVNRERFKRFRARVRVEAVEVIVTGDMGTASDSGVKLGWVYDEPAQTLTVTCTEHPWFMREVTVMLRIRALMEGL